MYYILPQTHSYLCHGKLNPIVPNICLSFYKLILPLLFSLSLFIAPFAETRNIRLFRQYIATFEAVVTACGYIIFPFLIFSPLATYFFLFLITTKLFIFNIFMYVVARRL